MSIDSNQMLKEFATDLMHLVRDRAIVECDRLASGSVVGPDGARWRKLLANDQTRKVVSELIPDIVDQVLFELLDAVDNDEFHIGWRQLDGSFADLSDLGQGEMAGWLMGSPGWRHDFSSQRFFDPLASLRLNLDEENENGNL